MADPAFRARHDVAVHCWVDHTSELELEIDAPSERAVFEEALAALGELMDERAGLETNEPRLTRREVSATAPDRSALLAEWLSELIYLAEGEGLVPVRAERLVLTETTLEATVAGRLGFPSPLVKAVTYHRLGIWEENETWRARVILDV